MNLDSFIDTSATSIGIFVVVFLVVTIAAKYLYFVEEKNESSSEEQKDQGISSYKQYLYAILIGLILAVISIVLYKQLLVKNLNSELLTDFNKKPPSAAE